MDLGLGLGFGPTGAPVAAGFEFDNAEAEAVVARMSSEPDDTRKALIDTFVGSLKTAGIWTKLDTLHVLAAHAEQAGLLNWKANEFNGTNGGASFVADRGFTPGTAGQVITTDFDPGVARSGGDETTDYQFNEDSFSGHVGVVTLTTAGNFNNADLAFSSGDFRVAGSSSGGGSGRGWLHSTLVAVAAPAGDAPHHIITSRSSDVSAFAYRNGVAGTERTTLVTGGLVGVLVIGAQSAVLTPSPRQIAMAHTGANLSAGEASAFYTAAQTYLSALGAM